MNNIEIIADKKGYDINGNRLYKLTVLVNGEKWFKPLKSVVRNNSKSETYTVQGWEYDLQEYVLNEIKDKLNGGNM